MLLSDPDNAVVVVAAVWGGVGCLNTPKIVDITRHPFTTTTVAPQNETGKGNGKSCKSHLNTSVLALCVQLLDLRTNSTQSTDTDCDSMEDSACHFSNLSTNSDIIQISSKNSTVHIFRHFSDLQAIIYDQKSHTHGFRLTQRHLSMVKTMVGFGMGRGGGFLKIGYVSAGGCNRGSSPFTTGCSVWIEEMQRLPYASSSAITTAVREKSHSNIQSSPISAVLSLFQTLSTIPDIPLVSQTSTESSKPSAVSSQRADSRGGNGFGFGFGGMSLKPRVSVSDESNSNSNSEGKIASTASASASASASRQSTTKARMALISRLISVLTFCENMMDRLLVQHTDTAMEMTPHSGSESLTGILSSARTALDSIDREDDMDGEEQGGEGGGGGGDPLDTPKKQTGTISHIEAVAIKLASFSLHLRPTATALLCSSTAEQTASIMQFFFLSLPPLRTQSTGSIESGEDIVLTYVMVELMSRLCRWCQEKKLSSEQLSIMQRALKLEGVASLIADKLISLSLDESALNAYIGALSESILKEISQTTSRQLKAVGEEETKSVNGFVDDLLRKLGDDDKVIIKETVDSSKSSSPSFCMGGTSVANCMVSFSQDVLYELFVSSVLERKNADDSKLNDTSTSYDHIGNTAESVKEMKRIDIQSLSNLITSPPTDRQSDNGTNLDIFSMLAATQCSLWLIDVIPLGELIGRFALQRFKVNKDSMDIFLEMVVAKQVDKLFMLAKADRNNTGKCEWDMVNNCSTS